MVTDLLGRIATACNQALMSFSNGWIKGLTHIYVAYRHCEHKTSESFYSRKMVFNAFEKLRSRPQRFSIGLKNALRFHCKHWKTETLERTSSHKLFE